MEEKRTRKRGNGAKVDSVAGAYTLALIILAFVVIVVSSFLLPNVQLVGIRQYEGRPNMESMEAVNNPAFIDLNSYFTLRLALSVVNVLLVIYLLFVYVRNYLALKSNFTLGIVAFLFSFLLYALSSMPVLAMQFGPFGVARIFSFVPMLFSAVGLIIFAKLSNE